MAKNIVVFADGTGNGASALSKTNVWRLYRAVDLDPPPAGQPQQVAFYIDGVGTSAFRPLALLGSVFGIGVSRNAKEIYKFVCRNYVAGDAIYAFGFSRGAFTARVLSAMITTQGVVPYTTEEELDRRTADAYRAYRRRYKLPFFSRKDTSSDVDARKQIGIPDRIRSARDLVIRAWRGVTRTVPKPLAPEWPDIAFIGVWDTVSAYGLPIEELTRGIDNWVWPLSMPNYKLSPNVKRARHALALDEERDSFQPLLWDERDELPPPAGQPPRLQQVWFSGVHSNVGGGYADDSLAIVPLEWMMAEAEAAGLRLAPGGRQDPRPPANAFGRRYDSRSGIAAYYRYQPRKLAARLDPPDETTRLQQNPSRKDVGFLKRVVVHESVLRRIEDGTDRYAPIGLPAQYDVLNAAGTLTPVDDKVRADRQEWVWNDVWRRRVNYFLVLFVSGCLLALPIIQAIWPPSACFGPQCLASPLFSGLGAILPGLAGPWVDAFARTPGWSLSLLAAIMLLLGRSTSLDQRIRDGSRELWVQSREFAPAVVGGAAAGAPKMPSALTLPGKSEGLPQGGVFRFRGHPAYQRTFQYLKWWVLPAVSGLLILSAIALVPAMLTWIAAGRIQLAWREYHGTVCEAAAATTAAGFTTSGRCWELPPLSKGARYRVTLTVDTPWRDVGPDTGPRGPRIDTDPRGFGNNRMAPGKRVVAYLLRRSQNDRWFQPMIRIAGDGDWLPHSQALEFACACGKVGERGQAVYTAEFKAEAEGAATMYVNDAIIGLPWIASKPFGVTDEFYRNNIGTAQVRLELLRPAPEPKPWWQLW